MRPFRINENDECIAPHCVMYMCSHWRLKALDRAGKVKEQYTFSK